MKKIAVINDLSGFGKCSLTAAIPVLSTLGVQCCPLPTAVLTGQTGFPYYHCKDLTEMIPLYMDAWEKNDVSFDGIYSGYVTGSKQLENIIQFVSKFRKENTFLLVDPVMGDDGRCYGMFSDEVLIGMKTLSRQADFITPNLTEACLLSDTDMEKIMAIHDKDALLEKASEIGQKLRTLANGDQEVIITGIKCHEDAFIYNMAITKDGVFTSRCHFFNKSFSGTGDLFASVICGCKAKGMHTIDAMKLAERFIYQSIAETMNDDVIPNNGVLFENHLIELIEGGLHYEKTK